MNLLFFDTNIILYLVRALDFKGIIKFLNPDDYPVYISVATEGEIKSLALQHNWGVNRRNILDNLLDQININEINQLQINPYIEIDSFSQRLNPGFTNYNFHTPRNMGKNDLWIASLAALLGLKLITTDPDFNHLHNIFFEVNQINPLELQSYLRLKY